MSVSLDELEDRLARPRKKQKLMRVSGKRVLQLQAIVKNRRGAPPVSRSKKSKRRR